MKINKIFLWATVGAAMSSLGLTSCADDMKVAAPEVDTPDGIVLRIPNLEAASQYPSTKATSEVAAAEGNLNDLFLIIFQKDGNDWKKIDTKDLSQETSSVSSSAYQDYNLELLPGDYKFYLLANLLPYLPDNYNYNSLNSEDDIKNLELSFEGALEAGKLPMVCLSKVKTNEAEAAAEGSEVSVTSTSAKDGLVIYADLNFLCSKVRYTILFDKTGKASSFRDYFVTFNEEVTVSNITNTTSVGSSLDSWDGAYFTEDLTAALAPKAYPEGEHYPAEEGTSADLTGTDADWTASQRAWQGVVYLPENLNASQKTLLSLTGNCVDASGNSIYTINNSVALVPDKDGIERANMYDIVLNVKNYNGPSGDPDIEVQVNSHPWQVKDILADFVHTYLTLESTHLSLTSTQNVTLKFDTDGRGLTKDCFVCASNGDLKDKNGNPVSTPVIVLSDLDLNNKVMTFAANPAISPSDLKTDANGDAKGTATCYITVGNIKKEIKVDYDLSPYFTVTPLAVKIQYDATNAASNVREFAYSTNLKGLKLKDASGKEITTLKTGYTTGFVTLTCQNPDAGEGVITVKANNNPISTVTYTFTATPAQLSEKFAEGLTVTVMPPYGDYYIYFRAINDYQAPDNKDGYQVAGEFLGGTYNNWPSEGNDNWNDWWNQGDGEGKQTKYHRIYVYTQNGEKINHEDNPGAWTFTGEYNDTEMKIAEGADNAGWYYYTLSASATGNPVKNTPATGTKAIEPGKTLVIIHNGCNTEQGYTVHRAPHHNDAGIPLFDFEDREGWVLYDPTMVPYYRVFDDKPTIEDVTYVVYTKSAISEWYNIYGIASNNTIYENDHKSFTIYYKGLKSDKVGDWYRTEIKLKAPKEDYSKGITLKIGDSTESVMFGGKAFKNNTGYFDGKKWNEGTPQ